MDVVEKPKRTRPSKIQAFDPMQVGCDYCPIKQTWGGLHNPCMPVSGNNKDADILVLGEAPGKNEDFEGKIFIGASGKLLRGLLPRREEDRLAFQNAVRCRPEANRTPTAAEVHACSIHLEADAEKLPLKAILGTGNVPLHAFAPEFQILKIHGTPFPVKLGQKVLWYYPIMHPAYVLRNEQESGGRARPIFENDIKKFFAGVDKWAPPEIMKLSPDDVIIPRTEEEVESLISHMKDPIAVDLETGDDEGPCLYPYKRGARILTASFSDGRISISFAVDHPEWQNDWGLRVLLKTIKNRRWIAHNVNFELSWFRFFAPNMQIADYDDTMAMARLYHQRENLLSLEVQSRIHLGVNVKKIVNVNAKKIHTYPLEQVLKYNGLDTMATVPLYWKLYKKIDKTNYKRLLQTIDSCVGMELQGLPVSLPIAQKLKVEWSAMAEKQVEDVKSMQEVVAYVRDTQTEFNIASARQLAKLLDTYTEIELPLTKKGNLSTNKTALAKAAETNLLVKGVLDYREAVKLEATYIDHVLEVPDIYPDGMLHPGYTVLLTSTGRLSSTNPNAQNFPRRRNGHIRNMIEVPKGFLMLAFDYAQLEARVLAMASKDRLLCESIIGGLDIHGTWRDHLLNLFPDYVYRVIELYNYSPDVDEKTLLKGARDRVKNQFVFASFYGSSAGSCAEAMGVPLSIIEDLAVMFWEEFSGVRRWLKSKRVEYQQTGMIRTLTGRERYQVLYKFNEPINGPIQGTAADIVADAMNEMTLLSRRTGDVYLHPRIQVHDDITFIVPEKNVEDYVDAIHPILTKYRYPWQIVPLGVECKVGTQWGALEEFATFSGEYAR